MSVWVTLPGLGTKDENYTKIPTHLIMNWSDLKSRDKYTVHSGCVVGKTSPESIDFVIISTETITKYWAPVDTEKSKTFCYQKQEDTRTVKTAYTRHPGNDADIARMSQELRDLKRDTQELKSMLRTLLSMSSQNQPYVSPLVYPNPVVSPGPSSITTAASYHTGPPTTQVPPPSPADTPSNIGPRA